ncbi:hypothetical protein HNP52_001535 [Sphingomonas kyeonggiensis]|uniref:Uncharacterized protein n=1 Tax=Sphingomonas kyeonggiensis TaxID=1268553 RepID=A0A7W7JZZ1_9SPHN|nr:hypothetical protein [Sphingomonas kyeonggiensis]MBB4838484.1 hypothetical protein [Sphingomonas kyeonggiensis]
MSVLGFVIALVSGAQLGLANPPDRAAWQVDETLVSLSVPQGYCANTEAAIEYDKRQRGRSLPSADLALFRCGESDPQSYDYYTVQTMHQLPKLTLETLFARMGESGSSASVIENASKMRRAIEDWIAGNSVPAFGGGQKIGSDERCIYSVYIMSAPAGSKVPKVAFFTCTSVVANRVTQFTRFMPVLDVEKAVSALAEVRNLSLSVK